MIFRSWSEDSPLAVLLSAFDVIVSQPLFHIFGIFHIFNFGSDLTQGAETLRN